MEGSEATKAATEWKMEKMLEPKEWEKQRVWQEWMAMRAWKEW